MAVERDSLFFTSSCFCTKLLDVTKSGLWLSDGEIMEKITVSNPLLVIF